MLCHAASCVNNPTCRCAASNTSWTMPISSRVAASSLVSSRSSRMRRQSYLAMRSALSCSHKLYCTRASSLQMSSCECVQSNMCVQQATYCTPLHTINAPHLDGVTLFPCKVQSLFQVIACQLQAWRLLVGVCQANIVVCFNRFSVCLQDRVAALLYSLPFFEPAVTERTVQQQHCDLFRGGWLAGSCGLPRPPCCIPVLRDVSAPMTSASVYKSAAAAYFPLPNSVLPVALSCATCAAVLIHACFL